MLRRVVAGARRAQARRFAELASAYKTVPFKKEDMTAVRAHTDSKRGTLSILQHLSESSSHFASLSKRHETLCLTFEKARRRALSNLQDQSEITSHFASLFKTQKTTKKALPHSRLLRRRTRPFSARSWRKSRSSSTTTSVRTPA